MAAALAQPPLKKWTREELDVLDAAGLLAGTRFELIDGEVFDKMGQNPPHSKALNKLATFLIAIFGAEHVRVQQPVEAATRERRRSLPEPDIAIIRRSHDDFGSTHPQANDVVLLCEISDTTQHHDLQLKAGLYSRAGYSEYIVADVNRQTLIVHRAPVGNTYTDIQVLRPGDNFHPLASPESSIAIADLF